MKSEGIVENRRIQALEMVTLVKWFIEVKRSGNWKLHFETLQNMLRYFHASGNFLYAKLVQLI